MAYEDLYWDIHQEITELKLHQKFNAQLEKMGHQDKHKFKDTRDRWTYARDKVVSGYITEKNEK